MSTNVLNIPGNYFIRVVNGQILAISGANTEIEAGGDFLTTAGANIELTAAGEFLNEAGANYEVLAGGEITLESGSDVTVTAPGETTVDSPETTITGNVTVQGNTTLGDDSSDTLEVLAEVISDLVPQDSIWKLGTSSKQWEKLNSLEGEFYSPNNVGNPYNRPYDPGDVYDTEANRRLGSVYVEGGVGIEKDLNVGGYIYGRVEFATTTTFIDTTATNVDQNFNLTFVNSTTDRSPMFVDRVGTESGLLYNPFTGKITTDRAFIAEKDSSTSTTTGALVVAGGVGIGENLYVGKNIQPSADNTGTIGSTQTNWAEAYVQDLYTKIISSTSGPIQVAPASGVTEILGDIRVRGANPIGTAPVVSNTLYVTMDGNDTNDGRAMDPSRACRTISGAVKSPYFQPGTQILVSAGFYLEDNPVRLKPYTSIRGSDIRTTFIEPINKTQDLFHVDSGCYLNYMTFLNGRSGYLEGIYAPGLNRGAYATAFPPLEGDEKIDLYHSPYIQNCTNQSGPWLKDGTMFVPNQTIQVPKAVGIGTWNKNTTTLIVNTTQGAIERGMSVNAGQQNPGFFDARTLLLANKPFIQEQVVAFVDQTFNTSNFTYDQVKCQRDTTLILEGIITDLRYDSDSESIFSGLQYWAQSSSSIPGQDTTTTEAIIYLQSLAVSYAVGGAVTTVNSLFNTLTNIITNGTIGITDQIISNGVESSDADVLTSYANLIANKSIMQSDVLSWLEINHPNFTFDTATCSRDVGYIIDSIAFDLKTNGNKQTIKSGVYYYNNSTSQSTIAGQIQQTSAAFRFIKNIIPNIVKAQLISEPYQTTSTQNIAFTPATDTEVAIIQNNLENIINIINNGPSVAGDREPINPQTLTVDSNILNAIALINANITFIRDEVIAFTNFSIGKFIYDQDKCSRDTGLIVDSIALDMLQSSNSESIFAGLQYWMQAEYVDAIGNQITTTTDAINFVKTLAISTASLSGGSTASTIVGQRFDDILNILSTGTVGVTDQIISNDLASEITYIIDSYNDLLAAKQSIQDQTIIHINSSLTNFVYDSAKCLRDTGLIIDSIALDLLFNGTSQSTFAGLQYWNQSGYVGGIADELTTTTNAIEYVNSLTQKIILNDTSGLRYQSVFDTNTVTQVTSLPAGTVTEAAIVDTDFNVILEILNTGTAGVTDLIVPNGITASTLTNVLRAYSLIQANKSYIIAEAIAFVETTKTTGFIYDKTKCARDVGFMLDSVSFDLLYGGNKQAVQSGVYYYGFDASSSAIAGEIPQTLQAYQYIRDILPNIIRSIPLATTYQGTETQVTGVAGSTIEVIKAEEKLDVITNIITNGPIVAEEPSPIGLLRSVEPDVIASAQLLIDNRDFIAAEVVAYANTFKTFLYDEDTCRRDIGFIIDSVAFDLLHGGNKQSIKSGVYYYGYSNFTEIPNEVPQTIAAYNFIKSILSSVIKNEVIESPYQDIEIQDTTLDPGTDYEVSVLQEKIDIITNIIRNGPSVVDARIPINLEGTGNSNFKNAFEILQANRNFIRAEVVAYLNTFGEFVYSREFCFRDVGILIENISYDAAFGGNEKSIESGFAYYDGVVSRIAGQESQTIAAIDYLNALSQKVIRNQECVNLLASPIYSQVINTNLTGGAIASDSLTTLYGIVNTIIANGPGAAPDLYRGTNADAAYVSAQTLLQANRKFIQEDTINYINNLVLDFPYSEIKCRRDTGLIVDSIAFDLLYPTPGFSQATFAGLQYWNQENYVGDILAQLQPTISAIEYLKDLSVKIIKNITPADDLVPRYQNTVTQVTSLEPATDTEANVIRENYNIILEILNGQTTGWTDRIITNGTASNLISVQNAIALLKANKNYLGHEVTAYVDATNIGFEYDSVKCRRDVGFLTDAVSFDLLHGGNRQSVQNGLYYYGFSTATITIQNQEIQTTQAFNYLATITQSIVQNIAIPRRQTKVKQVFLDDAGTTFEADVLAASIATITNIILNGPVVNYDETAIANTASSTATVTYAFNLLKENRKFIVEEVIAYIDQTYNPNSFNYDEALCYRDTGLIVDAVSQDILIGGNAKSIEAGLAYWNYGVSHVAGQETTTTMALNHAKDIALQIIANRPVDPQTGTITKQIINPFFQYGADYMPQEAVRRNFNIVVDIINKGPIYAPPKYLGGGLFALTGINGSDVFVAPQVVSVKELSENKYLIGLNTATIGFGVNATLYFGDTLTFPLRDPQVEAQSLAYSGNTGTWKQRKLDPIGSMGGSLVDGGVISERSPIQSFVYDAFTQLTQGGRGVHIIRNGYAQLVSVFTVFSSIGVQVDSGGIASIVNSNANFGDICLLAKGYGTRKFSGQLYNPPFKAYPESPDLPGSDYFDQFYPNGFWPNNAGIAVYMPDPEDRPHISLVMEIVPPEGYINEQGFPGFLNVSPTTSTLTTGTITLTGVSTENIFIGNSVFVRDQFGNTTSTVQDALGNWIPYIEPGTIVSDIGFNSITLSKALPSGGSDPENTEFGINENFFDLFFCGNAFYTVLSSERIDNPQYNPNAQLIPLGVNILSTASTGGDVSQIPAHVSALQYLNGLVDDVINNTPVTSLQTATTQTILPLIRGGGGAKQFIDLRFGDIIDIVAAPDLIAAEAVIPPALRTTSGAPVAGAGNAISLIEENIEFLADEISAYVQQTFGPTSFTYNTATCRRDAGFIITGTYYDVALGTNYNAVTSGVAYRRSVSSEVTASQLVQTIGAINFLKQESQIVLNTSTIAVSRSNAAYDEILNILAEGEAEANVIDFPSPEGVNPDLEKAKNMLVANKEFLKAEVIAYIADQSASQTPPFTPNFSYSTSTCARDVGLIIDAVSYDIIFGSNFRSVTAGLAYYRGNSVEVLGDQKEPTLGALNYLKTLMLQSISSLNNTVATSRLTANMNIIINIFDNGPTVAPTLNTPNPTNILTTNVNARRLLLSNKNFIKEEIEKWIAVQVAGNIAPFTTSFTYDVAACKRDVGYIIDALRYDITYQGNLESLVAGKAYFEGATSLLGPGEKAPTLAAYTYLSTIVQDIIQGVGITPSTGNTFTQDTSGTPGDGAAATFLSNRIQDIYDIIDLDNNELDPGYPSVVTPDTTWVNAGLLSAFSQLQIDKTTIQGAVISFIDATYVTFRYNKEKCARDVGFLVDALCYDILYGGNSASVQCAQAYFEGAVSVLEASERPATAAAFAHLSGIAQAVVQGFVVSVSPGNIVAQNLVLPAATASEGTLVDSLLQIIEDVITANTLAGLPSVVYPDITWTSSAIQYAVNNLFANSSDIIDRMIVYIDDEFVGTFNFDQDQCQRDVKTILQRLIYDIESGGRYNSVLCGLAYWNRPGTYYRVQLGENATRTDLFPHNATVNFYQRSYMSASGYVFEYVGAGVDYGSLPQRGVADPVQARETVQLDAGKVFFTSTDQNGDFRIGPGLVISQATGVLSGRTFTRSLFANLTPFILAIESGGG